MLKFFKNNKLIVVLCAIIVFIALIGLSIRSQSQSPPEQYVGDSVSFGQRVMSYPVNFVTGAIGNIFNMGESKEAKSKVKQLEAKNQRLE
ncbi:rod shape-determining protein MreC, partial [Staphylococcus warneri]